MRPQKVFVLRSVLLSMILICGSCTDSNEHQPQQPTIKQSSTSAQTADEITLHNATNGIVHFTVKPVDSHDYPQNRALRSGESDQVRGDSRMELTFRRRDMILKTQLDPGKTYSFIYNDNLELELKEGLHPGGGAEYLAPFVATPAEIVDRMLALAQLEKHDVLYDLGCGDGRIVIAAAQNYGVKGVGIDFDPELIKISQENAAKAGVAHLVEFRLEDVTQADFSDATVVTLYLFSTSNVKLRPRLEKMLKPGTRVVCHNYNIPGWESKEKKKESIRGEDGTDHTLYLYIR
jgi:SAM-dependent methyltransferase